MAVVVVVPGVAGGAVEPGGTAVTRVPVAALAAWAASWYACSSFC